MPSPNDTDETLRFLVDEVVEQALVVLDVEGKVRSWSAGAARLFGIPAAAALDTSFATLCADELARATVERLLHTALTDGRAAGEVRWTHPTDVAFLGRLTLVVRRDAAGTPCAIGAAVRMPAAGRDGDDLRRSEERMRLMVEAVHDYAIYMLDPDGFIMSWNRGAERLKGYRASEALHRHFSMFYPEDARAARHPDDELRQALAAGRYAEEGWRVRKDGTRFWANVTITAVYDDDGRHIGFTKVTRDHTERRRGEERLRQSEERFRLLVDGVRDYAIFSLDQDGYVTSWNAGAERINQYRADEIMGRHFSVFYTPEDHARGHPAHELVVARTTGTYSEEGWRMRKHGGRYWASVVITALYDDDGRHLGFAKVTRDLSDQRRMETEARRAIEVAAGERARAEEAQRLLQQRDEFISIAAHELRTPLTALHLKVGGVHEALKRDGAPSRALERVKGALRQIDRFAALVERILDVSRIVRGQLVLSPEEMDLSAVVAQVAEDFREPAARVGSELRVQTTEARGCWDKARMEQVAVNLLSNALKYGAGKPIDVTVHATARGARLVVQDRGIGIAAADLERIFSRFERAVPVQNYGGLGLGLYITRHIVVSHGGEVRATSTPGEGATFVVDLPRMVTS